MPSDIDKVKQKRSNNIASYKLNEARSLGISVAFASIYLSTLALPPFMVP